MSAIDDIEEHLTEIRQMLLQGRLTGLIDVFWLARMTDHADIALERVASLKAQQAPATLTPPKRTPTRTAPEPIVLAPGKRGTVKPKGKA